MPKTKHSKSSKKSSKKSLSKGTPVKWSTSQGVTEGKVVKKVTKTTKIKGHTAKPSSEDPSYEVESKKTGKHAIHKASSLKKASSKRS